MKYGNLVLLDHSGLTQQNTLAYYKKKFYKVYIHVLQNE